LQLSGQKNIIQHRRRTSKSELSIPERIVAASLLGRWEANNRRGGREGETLGGVGEEFQHHTETCAGAIISVVQYVGARQDPRRTLTTPSSPLGRLRVLWVASTYRGYLVNLPRVRLFVHLASVQWSKLIYVTGVSDSRSKFL
jgi:hypothetical protein